MGVCGCLSGKFWEIPRKKFGPFEGIYQESHEGWKWFPEKCADVEIAFLGPCSTRVRVHCAWMLALFQPSKCPKHTMHHAPLLNGCFGLTMKATQTSLSGVRKMLQVSCIAICAPKSFRHPASPSKATVLATTQARRTQECSQKAHMHERCDPLNTCFSMHFLHSHPTC